LPGGSGSKVTRLAAIQPAEDVVAVTQEGLVAGFPKLCAAEHLVCLERELSAPRKFHALTKNL